MKYLGGLWPLQNLKQYNLKVVLIETKKNKIKKTACMQDRENSSHRVITVPFCNTIFSFPLTLCATPPSHHARNANSLHSAPLVNYSARHISFLLHSTRCTGTANCTKLLPSPTVLVWKYQGCFALFCQAVWWTDYRLLYLGTHTRGGKLFNNEINVFYTSKIT